MITNFHAINGQLSAHSGVNSFDDFLLECAATHIRLVGHHDEQEAGPLQFCACGGNFRKNFKFGQARRRIWLAIAFQRAVDHTVAVEEKGPGLINC